jgi:hypothetical protein
MAIAIKTNGSNARNRLIILLPLSRFPKDTGLFSDYRCLDLLGAFFSEHAVPLAWSRISIVTDTLLTARRLFQRRWRAI